MGYIGTRPADAPLTSADIADGVITAPKIATDAVETVKVKDINVTTAKITDLNVTAGKLANTLDLSSKTVTLPTSAISYPTFTSITPSTTTNDSTSFVIVGTNFGAAGIPTVEFQNLTGGIVTSTSVVRDSATQLTVVATLPVDGTYYIRIELNTGLAVRSTSASLTISDAPVWTTGSGTLGTIAGDFSGAVATVAATGDTVTYSEVSGTGLTGAGNANCLLNTSTGAITTTDFGGSSTTPTTYNFTIRATDAQSQTSDRAFSLTSSFWTGSAYYLVVAGGGGGGNERGGGGGAGGYRTNYGGVAYTLGTGVTYTITVGTGGAGSVVGANGPGVTGLDSSFTGSDITDISSAGGGGGGGNTGGSSGLPGGSGGGAYASNSGGAATPVTSPVQGYIGGAPGGTVNPKTAGGGGGASEAGIAGNSGTSAAGDGGDGLSNLITGAAITYAGGGGGGCYNSIASIGIGGAGGGGNGGSGGNGSENQAATDGTDGLGGGGGGSARYGAYDSDAGDGGNGIVIIRMTTSDVASTTLSGTYTTAVDGSDTYIKWTAAGTLVT